MTLDEELAAAERELEEESDPAIRRALILRIEMLKEKLAHLN